MAKSHPVRMRVLEVKGLCPNGHKVGDEWLVRNKTPGGICMGGFSSCLPYLTALRFGGSFPWEAAEGTATIGCPDHVNQVVWKLDRLEAKPDAGAD
ncbi:MAG TPA: TIGR04076 family protein [Candidatus Sulfomarinibacteraceae bacterium]|nr:TIGR04076 family protein [Candidatus Sulfomarinibacteraceae bacterium]